MILLRCIGGRIQHVRLGLVLVAVSGTCDALMFCGGVVGHVGCVLALCMMTFFFLAFVCVWRSLFIGLFDVLCMAARLTLVRDLRLDVMDTGHRICKAKLAQQTSSFGTTHVPL